MNKYLRVTVIISLLLACKSAFAVGAFHLVSVTNKISQNKNSTNSDWKTIDNKIFQLISETKTNQITDQAVVAADEMLKNEKSDSFVEFRNKVSANGLKYLYEHSELKNSSVVKASKSIEKNLQAGVELKSEKSEISHKIDFNVDAFKNSAKLSYKGYLNCQLNFNYASSTIDMNINENLSDTSTISLSHRQDSTQQIQQLSYNITF